VQGGISGEQLSYTGESYTELKEKFLAEMQAEEEQPLDSLGFITVVHSDVDETMEEAMPDAAGMLRQMIDNKEFYTGEDSRGFESKVSYDNHGFEVEDFDFEEYRESDIEDENIDKTDGMHDSQIPLTVEVIYAQEQVVDFDEIVPDEPIVRAEKPAPIEQMATEPEARWEVPVDSEVRWEAPDEPEAKQETSVEPEVKWEEPDEPITEETTAEAEVEIEEPAPIEQMAVEPEVRWEAPDEPEAKQEASVEPEVKWEEPDEPIAEETTAETEVEIEKPAPIEQMIVEPEMGVEEQKQIVTRDDLRVRILISESMVKKLLELKESR
ncbi:MAG: hypothetical protein K2H34_02860, partial [Lachnospiraceae bacterium]|nr:hypothetical protein [Lachnospiraceae bacterium]